MTDYRIEAATKEEWAERALRAEAKLAKAVEALREIARQKGEIRVQGSQQPRAAAPGTPPPPKPKR